MKLEHTVNVKPRIVYNMIVPYAELFFLTVRELFMVVSVRFTVLKGSQMFENAHEPWTVRSNVERFETYVRSLRKENKRRN